MHKILDEILPRVQKPARYTGGEFNAVLKVHGNTEVKFALAFPDTYEIGMSNLGLRILYHILNSREDTLAERVFAPWTDMEAEMRQHNLPLYALESRTPLADFDIIGFSFGYELSYTNLLNMLDLAGIPVLASERGDDFPLVIAGGCCTYNPEPLADFLDAIVIGEGEEVINEIIDTYKLHHASGKTALLHQLACIDGVYIPSFYDVKYNPDGTVKSVVPNQEGISGIITKRFVQNFAEAPFPTNPVMPYVDIIHDRIPLEIMRGCSRGCRFCQAGMVYRPVRQRPAEKLKEMAETLSANTGYDEIALLSLSSSDYTGIEDLVHDLIAKYEDQRIGLSLPSIRADAKYIKLAAEIQKVRKSGLTLAPEAGTQRLRDIIDKNVTQENLLDAVNAALSYGWKRIKLYFMIGLPGETDEDIEGISALAMKVADAGRRRRASISVSVSSFVPKPDTPFQWRAQDSIEELERKQSLLRSAIRVKGVELSWHDARTSRIEAIFARGDRRLGKAIYLAWRNGCKMDAWQEYFDYDKWISAITEAGLDPDFYANRLRSHSEILPWDHIRCGVSKDFLIREDLRADAGEVTQDCRIDGSCAGCGITSITADMQYAEVSDVPCIAQP
ncbi:MAG: TIGR03960 family B12-binding radical SAM protein [Armatimonadota bacterium]